MVTIAKQGKKFLSRTHGGELKNGGEGMKEMFLSRTHGGERKQDAKQSAFDFLSRTHGGEHSVYDW